MVRIRISVATATYGTGGTLTGVTANTTNGLTAITLSVGHGISNGSYVTIGSMVGAICAVWSWSDECDPESCGNGDTNRGNGSVSAKDGSRIPVRLQPESGFCSKRAGIHLRDGAGLPGFGWLSKV